MSTALGLTWTQFKTFAVDRNLPMIYYQNNSHYFIFISDGQMAFEHRIRIDSPSIGDQLDFETNFEPSANDVPMGTKIIGEDGNYVADVTANREIRISDTHDNGGLDTVLALVSGVPQELKVGGTRKLLRKYIIFEAQDTGITWGFSNSTQSFDVFKSQLLMVPVGENTEIWFLYSGGGTGDVAIGEIS